MKGENRAQDGIVMKEGSTDNSDNETTKELTLVTEIFSVTELL